MIARGYESWLIYAKIIASICNPWLLKLFLDHQILVSMNSLARKFSAFFYALLAYFFLAGTASAQQWYSVGDNSIGDHIFVDVESIKPQATTVRFWLRTDIKEPKWDGALTNILSGSFKGRIFQTLELTVIDCNSNSGYVITKINRSEAGEVLSSETKPEIGTESFFPFPPGSVGLLYSEFGCKRGLKLSNQGNEKSYAITSAALDLRWKFVMQGVDAYFSFAEDQVTAGTGNAEGLTSFYQREEFKTPIKIGLSTTAWRVGAYATNCRSRNVLFLREASFSQDKKILYRAEYAGQKPMIYPVGSVGNTLIDEVCKTAAITAASAVKTPTPQVASKEKAATAAISTGTAWLSPSGYFVTAHHVIANAASVVLYGSDKQPLRARIIAADEKNDVALLWADLKGKSVRPIPFSKAPTSVGSRVFTIGYPHSDLLGVSPKVTSGELSGTLPLEPTKVLISVPVQSGNSGGPLINMAGEAVGLVIQKLSATKVFKATGDLTENTNFALRARYIDALIDDQPKIDVNLNYPKLRGTQIEDWVSAYKDSVFFVVTTSASENTK